MTSVTGEARIALMSKKDIKEDILEEILSWMPIDKNCKTPVADLFNTQVTFRPYENINEYDDYQTIYIMEVLGSDHVWYVEKRECKRSSRKMEERIIYNILKNYKSMINFVSFHLFFSIIQYVIQSWIGKR